MNNNRSTFILGVDLDAVVADYETAFRDCVAKQLDMDPATIPEATEWDYANCGWPVRDRAHFVEMHRRAVIEQNLYSIMPEIPGASDALWRLSDAGVYIRVITTRLFINFSHAAAVEQTVEWLDQHRIPYRDLCFVQDKPDVGADLYVDDGPPNIERFHASRGTESVLIFDQAYNRHLSGLRVHSWSEVVDKVAVRTGLSI
jgi:5'(3')-deoxyribonucleotidase